MSEVILIDANRKRIKNLPLPIADTDAATYQYLLNSSGSGGASGVLTTSGDLLTRDATQVVRLPVGTNNQVLSTDGTDPVWSSNLTATNLNATTITTTALAENTAAAGVTIGSALLKDGNMSADTVVKNTGQPGVVVNGTTLNNNSMLLIKNINESTATSGVTINNHLLKDSNVFLTGNLVQSNGDAFFSCLKMSQTTFQTIPSSISYVVVDLSKMTIDSNVSDTNSFTVDTINNEVTLARTGIYEINYYVVMALEGLPSNPQTGERRALVEYDAGSGYADFQEARFLGTAWSATEGDEIRSIFWEQTMLHYFTANTKLRFSVYQTNTTAGTPALELSPAPSVTFPGDVTQISITYMGGA